MSVPPLAEAFGAPPGISEGKKTRTRVPAQPEPTISIALLSAIDFSRGLTLFFETFRSSASPAIETQNIRSVFESRVTEEVIPKPRLPGVQRKPRHHLILDFLDDPPDVSLLHCRPFRLAV